MGRVRGGGPTAQGREESVRGVWVAAEEFCPAFDTRVISAHGGAVHLEATLGGVPADRRIRGDSLELGSEVVDTHVSGALCII